MTTLLNLTRAAERFIATRASNESAHALHIATAAARVVLDDEHIRGRTEVLAAMVWAAAGGAHTGKRAVAWDHEHEHEKERYRLYARTILQSGLV